MTKKILINNATILTMNKNKDIIENGVVFIENDKIVDIGKEELKNKYKKLENLKIIDGEKGILMPGMINCHTHASMIPFRTLADDYKDRLKKYLFPLEQKLVNNELVYIGARYAISEMLLSGVTTFCDMYYFEDEVAKAAEELNIRGILCETVLNFSAPDAKEPYGGLNYAVDFIEKWKNNELIIPGIAPHAPYTNSDESLIEAFNISKKYNVPITMHIAEMDYEWNKYIKEYGLSPVAYLNKLGILDSNFIGAHSVLVSNDDIEILKANNVGICHNIGSNAKGAKGVMPILKMKEKGINIGLGTDGPMSGNTLDILTQMPLVGKIHKLFNKDRTILPSIELIELATLGGAKVLGMDNKIGSIEKGKKADVILLETESVNMQPIFDYYATIVYSANSSNVDTVIVNGRVVVRNKKLISGNFKDIRSDMINLTKKIKEVIEK
ncbi:amidohydrolase [Clostridium tarantellae]|uniref:Amidohydrolase family protein n=1 Tax=Clostridium tarantellae TaxID=39493 RepID=A0A6I1MKT4_9CLOT|nr:amidohydrolase [Clostridium tarantellae]MPQ43640.1 amidohydrolase family protein [Clostridium tarantellae]